MLSFDGLILFYQVLFVIALLRIRLIAYIIVFKAFSKERANINSWLNNLFLIYMCFIILVTACLAVFVPTYVVVSSSCYAYVREEPKRIIFN